MIIVSVNQSVISVILGFLRICENVQLTFWITKTKQNRNPPPPRTYRTFFQGPVTAVQFFFLGGGLMDYLGLARSGPCHVDLFSTRKEPGFILECN